MDGDETGRGARLRAFGARIIPKTAPAGKQFRALVRAEASCYTSALPRPSPRRNPATTSRRRHNPHENP